MIEKGKKVKFHYTLKVEDKVIESSYSGGPLEYIHGKDNLMKGLQEGLEGHKEGETYTVKVKAEDGYGLIDPKSFVKVEKNKIPKDALKLGSTLSAKNENGKTIQGVISDILPENVIINFNHPLAGKTLTFDVEVLKVSLDF